MWHTSKRAYIIVRQTIELLFPEIYNRPIISPSAKYTHTEPLVRMDFWASLLLDRMLDSPPPSTVSDKNIAEDAIRRSLATELEFIGQTIGHLDKVINFSDMWNDFSKLEKDGLIEEIDDLYRASTTVSEDVVRDEQFYKSSARNIMFYTVAQSSNGRLSTALYDGSATVVGVLSSDELVSIIPVYSAIKTLRESLLNLADHLSRHGALANDCLRGSVVWERDLLIQEVEHLTNMIAEEIDDLKTLLYENI